MATRSRLGLTASATLVLVLVPYAVAAAEERTSTVGMPARIDQLILPGSEIEPKPLEDRDSPIVVRLTGVFPHGTDHRYDLVYYGLEPGTFDLRDYLRRIDGSSIEDVSPLTVEIQPVLPPGQVQPNQLESARSPYLGGYRMAWVAAGLIWIVGLFVILLARRKRSVAEGEHARRPVTLADRLRPMVEEAIAGDLSRSRKAELERLLLAFWRRRLSLESMTAADAMVAMRGHEEAGALLNQLELWLHRPGTAEDVDVTALLRPYQQLPAEQVPTEMTSSSLP